MLSGKVGEMQAGKMGEITYIMARARADFFLDRDSVITPWSGCISEDLLRSDCILRPRVKHKVDAMPGARQGWGDRDE